MSKLKIYNKDYGFLNLNFVNNFDVFFLVNVNYNQNSWLKNFVYYKNYFFKNYDIDLKKFFVYFNIFELFIYKLKVFSKVGYLVNYQLIFDKFWNLNYFGYVNFFYGSFLYKIVIMFWVYFNRLNMNFMEFFYKFLSKYLKYKFIIDVVNYEYLGRNTNVYFLNVVKSSWEVLSLRNLFNFFKKYFYRNLKNFYKVFFFKRLKGLRVLNKEFVYDIVFFWLQYKDVKGGFFYFLYFLFMKYKDLKFFYNIINSYFLKNYFYKNKLNIKLFCIKYRKFFWNFKKFIKGNKVILYKFMLFFIWFKDEFNFLKFQKKLKKVTLKKIKINSVLNLNKFKNSNNYLVFSLIKRWLFFKKLGILSFKIVYSNFFLHLEVFNYDKKYKKIMKKLLYTMSLRKNIYIINKKTNAYLSKRVQFWRTRRLLKFMLFVVFYKLWVYKRSFLIIRFISGLNKRFFFKKLLKQLRRINRKFYNKFFKIFFILLVPKISFNSGLRKQKLKRKKFRKRKNRFSRGLRKNYKFYLRKFRIY